MPTHAVCLREITTLHGNWLAYECIVPMYTHVYLEVHVGVSKKCMVITMMVRYTDLPVPRFCNKRSLIWLDTTVYCGGYFGGNFSGGHLNLAYTLYLLMLVDFVVITVTKRFVFGGLHHRTYSRH